jgi:predicted DsbA family dithiol-disulfide isomerase
MLIPLPIDINIATINILKENYNISDVPTLLINEKIKLTGVYNIKEIEKEMKNAM